MLRCRMHDDLSDERWDVAIHGTLLDDVVRTRARRKHLGYDARSIDDGRALPAISTQTTVASGE